MADETLRMRAIADAARRLRADTVALLDSLSEEEYGSLALPARTPGGEAWTVADVFRHLAEMDRRSATGTVLTSFLPARGGDELEDRNDEDLARLRDASRAQLRDELLTWGRRLQRLIGLTPDVVGRRTIPTLFGRVSIAWFACLRIYDEWIHQDDVRSALHRDQPPPDLDAREILAAFQLRALPAGPLRGIDGDGVVEVAFHDLLAWPAWRFDLASHTFGPRVVAEPSATISTDVATWCRIAADRLGWRQAERDGLLAVEGDDPKVAERILDVVRVV